MRGSLDYSAITEWGSCLRREFVPSRKRYKPSVMDSGAAMIQRKGDAFPCLIPENCSQADALNLALEINPFERLLTNALSPVEQACVQFNSQNPTRVKQLRHKVIRDLNILSDSIRPVLTNLSKSLPELAPARKLHIPLIRHLVKELDYADLSLPDDLIRGMPIVGMIPPTASLPEKVTTASMSMREVLGAVRDTNEKVLKSLSKPTLEVLKQKCWDLSQKEVEMGWLSEPTAVAATDLDNLIPSPRFCIAEHCGIQEPKYCLIEDLAKSNVNKTVQMSETYCPHGLDSFFALTRPHHVNGATDLKQWPVDFPKRIKRLRWALPRRKREKHLFP